MIGLICTLFVVLLQVTVVLKGLFTPDDTAEGGSSFATDLETDVTAECKKLGTIEKVSSHVTAQCVRSKEKGGAGRERHSAAMTCDSKVQETGRIEEVCGK